VSAEAVRTAVGRSPGVAAAVAVVGAVSLAYAWPLVDGSAGLGAADLLLRVLAAEVASLAAAHCASRAFDGARAAWGAVVVAGQLLAAIWLAGLLVFWSDLQPPPEAVLAGGHVLAVLLLVGGVYRLAVHPFGASTRRVVEVAVLSCAATLGVWGAAQVGDLPELSAAGTARVVADAALVGVAVLALLLSAGRPGPAWPLLGGGALAVAAADALEAGYGVSARLTGVLWCSGLLLVAAAARAGPSPADRSAPASRRPGWLVPVVVAALAPVLGAVAAVVRPADLVGVSTAVGVAAGLLLLLLLRQQLLLAERRVELSVLAEQRSTLEYRAFHDDLTDLANRALFLDRLEHALALHRRHHRALAVLFGDLDGFKAVNDRFGHHVGNEVLRGVAERIRVCLRPADTLARLSGDEFAVLLEEDSDAAVVVQRIEAALAEPLVVGDLTLEVGMSFGIAVVAADDDTPTATELLSLADERMFVRKADRNGRTGGLVRGRPSSGQPQSMHAALPHAIESGDITVAYQPLVDPGTGVVVGLEALARWRHGGQQVPPPVFVELARGMGLLSRLTVLVADRACEQLHRWCESLGNDRLTVSVNIEPDQLGDAALHAELQELRTRHQLRPGQLVLEVSAATLDGDATTVRLSRELAAQGTPLSLTDVDAGVGLGHLHRLALACVKVNERAPGSTEDAQTHDRLLRALKGMGRELELSVVVEGVEDAEHLSSVRRVGGLIAQGFVLARPAPAGDLDQLIATGLPPG
jgi:diguanylate cyclase